MYTVYPSEYSDQSVLFSLTTIFMRMTLNYFSLFTHSTVAQAFLTIKTLSEKSLPG